MTKKVFGTKEWAEISANCSDGCENNCKYCYAKEMAVRFKRRTAEDWVEVRPAAKKRRSAVRHSPAKVMFPTTHDILPCNLDMCIETMHKLLDAGHEILLVTKPRFGCMEAIFKEFNDFRDRILYRFTIGSASNAVLKHWEPGAPSFEERVGTLYYGVVDFYIRSSVSCEPMLDDKIHAVIEEVRPYISDAIWLGKMNNASARLAMNGGTEEDFKILEQLMETQTDEKIMELYERYKDDPKIKWKESIKAVVGLEIPTEAGQDI